jgi:nucleotide-binding universal stress UspA family protein
MNDARPILLVVGLSPAGEAATTAAIELARKTGRPLAVVATWWVEPRAFGAVAAYEARRLAESRRRAAEQALERVRQAAGAAGIESHLALVEGPCGWAAAAKARELDAWTLVVGDADCGRVQRLLEGTLSRRIARRARCRVLSVRRTGRLELVRA